MRFVSAPGTASRKADDHVVEFSAAGVAGKRQGTPYFLVKEHRRASDAQSSA
jgi:hypothetical protein